MVVSVSLATGDGVGVAVGSSVVGGKVTAPPIVLPSSDPPTPVFDRSHCPLIVPRCVCWPWPACFSQHRPQATVNAAHSENSRHASAHMAVAAVSVMPLTDRLERSPPMKSISVSIEQVPSALVCS